MLWRFASALRSSGSAALFAALQSSAREVIDTDKALKVIALILLLFLILSLLCSCGKEQLPDRFLKVADYNDCQIYVDTQTGVEYVSRGDAFAPLFNSYGAPLVFHGFDAREDRLDYGR